MTNGNQVPVTSEVQYAQDAVKQVLTLASGILALSLTFTKDFVPTAPASHFWGLYIAWIALLASILTGVACLIMDVMPGIQAAKNPLRKLGWPWSIQLGSFAGGLVFLAVFAAGHLP